MPARSVLTEFWDDAYIMDLEPDAKYLFLYLLTNSRTNMLGIYELPVRKIVNDTGLEKEKVESLLKGFEMVGKAFHMDNHIILINFQKHQKLNGNMKTSALTAFHSLPVSIKKLFGDYNEIKDYPSLIKGFQSLCQALGELNLIELNRIECELNLISGAREDSPTDENSTPQIQTTDKFTPPTLQEAQAYADNSFMEIDVSQFYEHYTATGWRMSNGRYPADWTALLRLWKSREKDFKRGERKSEAPPIDVSRFSKKSQGAAS